MFSIIEGRIKRKFIDFKILENLKAFKQPIKGGNMKKYSVSGLALVLVLGFFALSQQEVKDLVCGMKLKAEEAKFKSEYKGTIYYFCSADCKAKFDKEPEKYAVKTAEKPRAICCALDGKVMKEVKIEKKEIEKENRRDIMNWIFWRKLTY